MVKEVKNMSLGELVDELSTLMERHIRALVKEDDPGPYPEIFNGCGGVRGYNKKIRGGMNRGEEN